MDTQEKNEIKKNFNHRNAKNKLFTIEAMNEKQKTKELKEQKNKKTSVDKNNNEEDKDVS